MKQRARRDVFRFCDGHGDESGVYLHGESYESLDDVPDEEIGCEVDGVSVSWDDGEITLSDGEDVYEISELGSSTTRPDAGMFSVGGPERVYHVSDGEISLDQRGTLAPISSDDKLEEMCDEVGGEMRLWERDGDRPGQSCQIELGGGRSVVVSDGEVRSGVRDDEYRFEFGKVSLGSSMAGAQTYEMSVSQGQFDAPKSEVTADADGFEAGEANRGAAYSR